VDSRKAWMFNLAEQEYQIINSPNYPQDFLSGTECRWSIDASEGLNSIELEILDLELIPRSLPRRTTLVKF